MIKAIEKAGNILMGVTELEEQRYKKFSISPQKKKEVSKTMKKKETGGIMARKEAKQNLLKLASKFGITHGKKQLMGVFSLQTGYSPERVEIYLNELEEIGLVKIRGDKITIPGEIKDKQKEEETG